MATASLSSKADTERRAIWIWAAEKFLLAGFRQIERTVDDPIFLTADHLRRPSSTRIARVSTPYSAVLQRTQQIFGGVAGSIQKPQNRGF
jgi:hypothetical protein